AGASDSGSGIAQVELWAKKESGAWVGTGLVSGTASGSFAYANFTGEGTYDFALRATDAAGNSGAVPTGSGLGHIMLDSTPPAPRTAACEPFQKLSQLQIAYAGAGDEVSGLPEVRLWSKFENGSWVDTGLSANNAAGTFSFP